MHPDPDSDPDASRSRECIQIQIRIQMHLDPGNTSRSREYIPKPRHNIGLEKHPDPDSDPDTYRSLGIIQARGAFISFILQLFSVVCYAVSIGCRVAYALREHSIS